ncbi:zf-HC2 domain-containing protein [Tessaracoccus sp. OH4464_COT-324]|uniref:zf-HC2 domain-containing protein n=1 Tax=Tessaracoccus sp. OH4464_COT-324 TaxID=2491059 RepID=UPI001319B985|nr:zf-HC2 domain-containing protein [Tessaracoccus sp. OH4464_COT-324]
MADHVHGVKDECLTALERVHEFLSHELLDADEDTIRAHLAACEHCMEQYEIESTIQEMIRRATRVSAPASLSIRIRRLSVEIRG